jgi:UDP-2-acetamido-2,6-beta-L-arabino-hexul-4-ose reductase
MITVGITGQQGFVGYHLTQLLRTKKDDFEIIAFDDSYFSEESKLTSFVSQCDTIVHLAGVNRHPEPEFVYSENINISKKLINALNASKKAPHIIFSSSTQEEQDNPYGKAKKEAREMLSGWAKENNAKFTGLVIPNVFGPFGKPFYNSFIATFCHQLTHNEMPNIQVDSNVNLIYVGSLAQKISEYIYNPPVEKTIKIEPDSTIKVSEVLAKLLYFKETYVEKLIVPGFSNSLEINLFNTYRSFIEPTEWQHNLKPNTDNRGSLYEVIKMDTGGQVFYSTTKPGITRGNHYHLHKVERFCVIGGKASIKLRQVGTEKVYEFIIDGTQPAFVDMPVLYTHNITNIGNESLTTLFWSNEIFDPNNPDTYFEEV